jgi:CheY-like chemotaxis protein
MSVETILILDDDAANLHGISAVLRHEHYTVLEASDSSQAVELGTTCGPIALLVTDMDLAQSSGTDVALKLVERYSHLPVLLISGTPMMLQTSSCFRQPA